MRVTNQIVTRTLLSDIQRTQRRILDLQRQASSGHRINLLQDDPFGAVSSIRLQTLLARQEQYRSNAAGAKLKLDAADGALSDLNDVFTEMKALAIEMVDETQTAESRAAAAQSVAAALSQALAISNRQVDGEYLFAGRKSSAAPFVSLGGGIAYQGDLGAILLAISDGQTITTNLTGSEAFGGVSAEVKGFQDLNPAATTATKLSALNAGDGVSAGSVLLNDGLGNSQTIDLSATESLGDVIDKLNSNTIGITASLTTTGGAGGSSRITLTKAGANLTVNEVASNTTAADLGILATTGAGATLNGTDLDPELTGATTLASLMNNVGVTDLASGLSVTNGSNSGTISFAGLTTVEDLLNEVRSAGLYVDAQISSDGRKIDLKSLLSGAELRVGENGGTTATNLGVRSLYASTLLSTLNRGQGVTKASVSTDDDFIINQRDGTTISVNVSAATTIQDVINAINTDAENTGDLTASLNPTGNGIRLVDASAGATALSVVRLNDSLAASGLGIEKAVSGGGGTLTGSDVNPIVTSSLFTILADFQTALEANDTEGIAARAQELDDAFEDFLNQRAVLGGRLQQVEMADNRLALEQGQSQALLSETYDVDLAEVITQLGQEQVALQAGLQVAATSLQLSLLDYL